METQAEVIGDIIRMIEEQGAKAQKSDDERKAWQQGVEAEIVKMNRPGAKMPATESGIVETWTDVKTHKPIPVLEHKHSLAALQPKPEKSSSMGRVLRGIVLGGRADDARELDDERKALGIVGDPSGGYTVAGALSDQWIDALRAAMVLSQAGARTVPMDTKTLTIAKVTADPSVSWHGENAALATTDPTFGAVRLDAKTCVCLTRLSLELAQDSVNIEQILQSVITSAMAHAIDAAGLVGVTTDAIGAPATGAGIFNLTGRSKATSIGAPTNWDFLVDAIYTLMASNVPMDQIGAFIAHPAVWKKMRKLKTGLSGDNTPLEEPDEIQSLPKLWTTAAPFTSGTTCSGVIGNWRDLLFGVRKSINVRVLNEAFMGSNLQVGILAYARVDFAAVRAESFYTAEGITV